MARRRLKLSSVTWCCSKISNKWFKRAKTWKDCRRLDKRASDLSMYASPKILSKISSAHLCFCWFLQLVFFSSGFSVVKGFLTYAVEDCKRCSLYPIAAGPDCSAFAMNCETTGCSGNGVCIRGQCVCEDYWTDLFCSRPLCTKVNNCSQAGVCVGPNQCECFTGMSDADCSVCDSPLCQQQCNIRCIHGECDSKLR